MFVKLRFKTIAKTLYGAESKITLTEAKKIYKEKLEKDNNVIEVYLIKYGTYHWYRYKTLKGDK